MAGAQQAAYPKMYLYRRIAQAKLFIDQHFTEDIDLDNIADEAAFSKFHFLRLFRQAYSKTPHQYLIAKRIAYAQLLLATGISVSDTCYETGFTSLGAFSSLFKKVTGETPSFYQQRLQAVKADLAEAPLRYIPGCFAASNGWQR